MRVGIATDHSGFVLRSARPSLFEAYAKAWAALRSSSANTASGLSSARLERWPMACAPAPEPRRAISTGPCRAA